MKTVATTHDGFPHAGRPQQVQLVVVDGEDMGRAATIGAGACVVGTESSCTLVLTDERVSRRHCELAWMGTALQVRDLGSTNGTFHEGARVTTATLPLGATLKVGHTFLRLLGTPSALEVAPSTARSFGELVGESLAIREVFAVLSLAATSDVTVLLEGETGVGKELAARAIHGASPRRSGPFVAVDCSALPEGLVESELFGHVRGAFTGAAQPRRGAFVRASGGTLFLDELDSIPVAVQTRLLRVIEERRVRPVGSDQEVATDTRIVAGSREDLRGRVAEGKFRPDLFYRLSVVHVVVPPLRARREDIAPIASAILRQAGLDPKVSGPKLDALYAHDWPGNARELRNVLHRAIALAPAARDFASLPISVTSPIEPTGSLTVRMDLPFSEAKQRVVEAFEKSYLAEAMRRADDNVSAAARTMGLDRKHLRDLLLKHGLLARR